MNPMRDQAATWIGVAGDPEFLQHVGRFFGPHCGIVVGEPALLEALEPDKLLPSTDATPEKFELGTLAPAGSFYAVEASRRMGLGDTGAVRVGLAPYTDSSDVARLVQGLRRFITER